MDEQELWQLGDEELLGALVDGETELRRTYGRQLTLLGELVTRDLVETHGYRSASRLLQDLLRISRAEANRRLAHADAVSAVPTMSGPSLPPRLPHTAEAVCAGAIGAEHVETIRRVLAELSPEVDPQDRELAERTLADAARTLGPAAVAKLGRTIQARLDQDGRPPIEPQPRNTGNELRWTSRSNGELELRGQVGAEGAAWLTSVLSPLAKPRPAVNGQPDPRTRAERQGDALVEALRLAANSGDLPTEGGERPTLVVTLSLETLRDQLRSALLGDSTLIDAATARKLACDSGVIPVVLGSNSEPLDIGRKTRTVPTALRRALVVRDGGCTFPGCPVPARWCDAHHLISWADSGPTRLDNLILVCGVHHDLLHHSAWTVTLHNGQPEFTPPAYIDPRQRPRRNPVHLGVP